MDNDEALEILEYHEQCTCNNPTIICRYCEAVTTIRQAMKENKKLKAELSKLRERGMTKDKGLEKILDRLYIMTPYGRIGLSKSEKQKYQHQILSHFKSIVPSEGEMTMFLKTIQFKDFIRSNGMIDSRKVTMHFNVRKRVAKAIRKMMLEGMDD